MTTETYTLSDTTDLAIMFGVHNTHIKHIESALHIDILDKGSKLTLKGDDKDIKTACRLLEMLEKDIEKAGALTTADIDAALRYIDNGTQPSGKNVIKTKKKTIQPRSPNQGTYISLMKSHDLTFGLGPAGTGKTYLAVAMAVSLYLEGKVERLIFTRPAVEAGEKLGFLPGDMKDKVDPYLRPIYDALHDMLPADLVAKKIEMGEIEIAPLAFMRGRTLSRAFVIMDEAQNTTPVQMKMVLTRLGEASRMIVTGDLSQTDLPSHIKSGLREAVETLENVDGVGTMRFEQKDVIRHPLVSRIIKAYDAKKD